MGLAAGKRPSKIPNVKESDLVEINYQRRNVGNYFSIIDNIINWLKSDKSNTFQGHRNPPPPPLKEYEGRFDFEDDEHLMNEINQALGIKEKPKPPPNRIIKY